MWKAEISDLEGGRARKIVLWHGERSVRYSDVARAWQRDEAFRRFFIGLLAAAPFPAYLWETPPVTVGTLDREFECVLVDSPHLAAEDADATPFREHFERAAAAEQIVTFWSFGRDALLVVPCPLAETPAYPHLAAFARQAPESQQHALWCGVGAALEDRLTERPVWISTSGLGVSWLHVRLDSFPKYYVHGPYRDRG